MFIGIGLSLIAQALSQAGLSSKTFGVTLSGVVGGNPESGTGIVTINQVTDEITPVIAVSRSTGVAPLAITFDALGTTAPSLTSLPFSEIYYAWTFGDTAGGATWAYGTNPGVALKNEAIGPVAAHVFEDDGDYTVTCWAFYLDSGGTLHSGSATTAITVTDPDTVFASNTIYISQSGLPVPGVGGVPLGANVQLVTDPSTIETLVETYKRVLLKRGDTWPVTASIDLDQVSRTGEGIIGAYGTGAKPILNLTYDGTVFRTSAVCDDWRFVDLKVTCDGIGRKENGRSFTLLGSTDLLLLRCEASGAYYDITSSDSRGLYIVDSVLGPLETWVSGAGGYCIYASRSERLHIMGTHWYGGTNHGCRLQGVKKGSIDYNTGGGNIPGNAPGAVLTLRGWSPYTGSEWTENVVISRNVFAGNANNLAVFGCHPQFNTSEERIRRVIADGNYVSGVTSLGFFSVATEFTVRNNLFVTSNSINVEMRGESSVGSPFPSQSFFYNNTLYSTASGSSHTAFLLTGTISGMVLTNNIAYAPNATTTFLTNGTGGQVTATYNSSDSQIKNDRPWAAITPVNPVDFTPSGSYAVDGGTWVPVYKNYFGDPYGNPRNMGAI